MMVSDALLGGLAGYYCQSTYITFEQAEEVERAWRNIFRWKFKEEFADAQSKPRIYYYQARGKERYQRRHLWAVALSAVTACVNKAMADVHDTAQRAAARSAVALAMERWGCRSPPARWDWQHLVPALEASLRHQSCKYVGDAWMLATALLEREHGREWARRHDTKSKWARDFGNECKAARGRWSHEPPTGDPASAGDAAAAELAAQIASAESAVRSGELTHAVAGNSKNLAGMAKNAKVAASGKQGGMKGGYL